MTTPAPPTLPARDSRIIQRIPFFYGWVILIVGTFGLIMTSPAQTYAVSVFIESFIADLGLSRSLVSTLYTIGTLTGSLALPFVGRQLDRRGARFMTVVVGALFGLTLLYMSSVRNAVMLGFGFVALRMLGQGSLGVISQYPINQWWVRRRGMINGISGVGISLLGLGLFPTLLSLLIPALGWRLTYVLLAGALWLLLVPVGAIFIRRRPEDYGLAPDGGVARAADGTPVPAVAEENWTLDEARRTSLFWIAALGIAAIAMLSTGLFFHMVSILEDAGLAAEAVGAVFVPVAATTALVNLGGGALVDRIAPRLLLAAALLLMAVALFMAPFLRGVPMAFGYGMVLGATMGLNRSVSAVIWATYFGRRHLGAITGLASFILVAGSALGPMPFGIARDLLGSYTLVVTGSAVIPLILALAALRITTPRRF